MELKLEKYMFIAVVCGIVIAVVGGEIVGCQKQQNQLEYIRLEQSGMVKPKGLK